MPRTIIPAIDRFRAKVDTSGGPDACHPWTAACFTRTGYGAFHPRKGTTTTAHRFAYEAFVGPIPAGYDVDHTCHNGDLACPGGRGCYHRPCANWRHLEAVPPELNHSRSHRSNENKDRCPRGHRYTPENTRLQVKERTTSRKCITCERDREKQRGPRQPSRTRRTTSTASSRSINPKEAGSGR